MNYFSFFEKRAQVLIDSDAVLAEVARTCLQRPSETLAVAAWTTFRDLAKGHGAKRP